MLRAGKAGWVVVSDAIRSEPNAVCGKDFRRLRVHRLSVICVLNHGQGLEGTLPPSSKYDLFAERCADYVAKSHGCHHWVIGCEPNATHRRPRLDGPGRGCSVYSPLRALSHFGNRADLGSGVDSVLSNRRKRRTPPETITPALYAQCYRTCRTAIRAQPGHEQDRVLTAAVAAWNTDSRYAGNEWGDWVLYFSDVLDQLDPNDCDGFALHTRTTEPDPRLISSAATQQTAHFRRHIQFRAYRDFLGAVPSSMRHLPAFITQAHPGGAWHNTHSAWVEAAYDEIDLWNRTAGNQAIHALALYRWAGTGTAIQHKTHVVAAFRRAMQRGHSRRNSLLPSWSRGTRLMALTETALHEAPPVADGVTAGIDVVSAYTVLAVERSGAVHSQGKTWWYVREVYPNTENREGWTPQEAPSGERVLDAVSLDDEDTESRSSDVSQPIVPGKYARTLDIVRMRRTPGFRDKMEEDTVVDVPAQETVAILSDHRPADGLRWWLARWRQSSSGAEHTGWMAEFAPSGQVLLVAADKSGRPDSGRQRFEPGDLAETLSWVRLRKSPGHLDKPDSDIVANIWQGTPVTILRGPAFEQGLAWWRVRTVDMQDNAVEGWMAEQTPDGTPLIGKRVAEPAPDFEVGDIGVVRRVPVRVRRSPGFVDKPEGDVLGEFGPGASVVVQGGPEDQDELTWWRAGGITRYGEAVGWIAQATPGGVPLVGRAEPLPATDIPNPDGDSYLGTPFAGLYGIGQLWGENEWYYRRFAYDGVPLIGHNGLDFLLPSGNPVYSTEAGTVISVDFEVNGLGWYVLIGHNWGESIYAHLRQASVIPGQRLLRGDRVGISGNSGASTGPHLHFAIRIAPYDRADGWGGFSDPLPYLNPKAYLLPNYVLHEQYQMHSLGQRPVFPRLDLSGMDQERDGFERP